MYRYLAIVWNPRSVEGARTQESLRLAGAKLSKWSVAYEGPGILAMHMDRGLRTDNSYAFHRQRGVVLGQLFDRRDDYSRASEVRFDDAQAAAIVSSGGRYLVEHYWGSYLAILYDEAGSRHHILRDPIGTLPCYHVRHAGVDIFFSHFEDCLQLAPLSLQVNRRHLTNWLLFSSVRTDETSLEGITQLARGECLTLSPSGQLRIRVWDPTAFAARTSFQEPDAAARALRSTVQNAVNAWASRYRRIAHRVSGGLDSAIVAGCLAQAPSSPDVIYLNVAIDTNLVQHHHYLPGVDAKTAVKLRALAGHGDERYYARLVAQRWNRPLIEKQRYAAMDLERLRQVPLGVAPSMYFTAMEMDDADLELIASHGSQAFFSGQAGDSVLLATLQPLPAIDHAYVHGLSRDLWRQIAATTALSKDSLWSVMGKTVKHGLLRRPYTGPMKLLDRPTLLTQERAQTLREEELEGTFATLANQAALPPGKKNHVKGVASAFYNYVFYSGDHADHIDPLNAQPVWELMLQVPSYTALVGGVSRGLARHAFADLLPPEIRRRQTKGTGNLFYQQIIRRNRGYLLERLESGLLVQEGFLDRRRLTDCLTAEEPSITIPAAILMAYLAAELWLQQLRNAAAGHAGAEHAQTPLAAAV